MSSIIVAGNKVSDDDRVVEDAMVEVAFERYHYQAPDLKMNALTYIPNTNRRNVRSILRTIEKEQIQLRDKLQRDHNSSNCKVVQINVCSKCEYMNEIEQRTSCWATILHSSKRTEQSENITKPSLIVECNPIREFEEIKAETSTHSQDLLLFDRYKNRTQYQVPNTQQTEFVGNLYEIMLPIEVRLSKGNSLSCSKIEGILSSASGTSCTSLFSTIDSIEDEQSLTMD